MSSEVEQHGFRRKRRRFARRADRVLQENTDDQERSDSANDLGNFPHVDFVRLISLIIEHEIPILFPGSMRPRNTFAMLGAGGSFLVFREERTMDQLVLPPGQIRSLDDSIVLKRTRILDPLNSSSREEQNPRYASLLAELQILLHSSIMEHPNFIDLQGLTWDYETDDQDGSISVWPVLGLQQALYSMDTLSDELSDAPLSQKLQYCYDIAKALSFLHDRGVVHCDVKAENVLICVTSASGDIAKLSDFGSAIMDVTADTNLPKGVAGTRPWNAPEQSHSLQGLGIFKVDVFSYGMLLWRFLCRSSILQAIQSPHQYRREALIDEIESLKRSDELSSTAVKELQVQSTERGLEVIAGLLQEMLALKPTKRCGMTQPVTMLEPLLHPPPESPTLVSREPPTTSNWESKSTGLPSQHRETSSSPASFPDSRIFPVPPEPFYNEFDRTWEMFEDESPIVKQQLITSLKFVANQISEDASMAAEAAYQLSVCYVNGFGVAPDLCAGCRWSVQAAHLGSSKAKADIWRLTRVQHSALREVDSRLQSSTIFHWLGEATRMGSIQAAKDLKPLDPESFTVAMSAWKHRFALIRVEDEMRIPSHAKVLELGRSLTAREINTTALNDRGHHLIHLAASLEFLDILRKLVEDGANINLQNAKGETALLCACRAGNAQAAWYLLGHGASVEASTSGETPLHWLIALPESEVDRLACALIAQGADLEAQHTETEINNLVFDIFPLGTPLDWAVHAGALAVVEVLIKHGADPFNECSQYSSLVRAVSKHDFVVVEKLLESRHATLERVASMDTMEQTILFHAICCNSLYDRILAHGSGHMLAAKKTIELLLSSGCEPDSVDGDGTTALHTAAGYCDVDFLDMLCKQIGWDKFVNTACGEHDRTPLLQAIASQRIENVRYLVKIGANTYRKTKGHTLLHICAGAGDEDFSIQVLHAIRLDGRVDLNERTTNDNLTAYEIAVLQCHLKIADLLVEHGADVAFLADRQPPLFSNIIADPTWDSFRSLHYYLEKGVYPFVLNPSTGITALHIAASAMDLLGDPNTGDAKLEMLLKVFNDVEKVNARTRAPSEQDAPQGGQTPLHFAAKFGVYFAARRLLNAGADWNIRDKGGMTPADLALQQLSLLNQSQINTPREWVSLSNLRSTHTLLKQAMGEEKASPMSPELEARDVVVGEYTRSRFSRLGFKTE
ncbi:hypothetical protein EPUS_05408 [Endocarpon pusillum Z07020]|uniref:Protein kinase domain-containing protein n=1 Tax=Endocarpon pusillum (strain Z07020 / HMAS-L-300199) TaxID=1263415 RepID=U1GDR8_ENDPU|nr:uncharacterized protein EPUS_05408 [Endocarpon pusillum Z07020]ERF69866.1 hypothetical protein EPUS_05408 [Endocarpon pusillum Z07020]